MNETLYQIFDIRARWSEETEPGKDYEGRWIEGLPPGRNWNGCSTTTMPAKNTTLEEIERDGREVWWPAHIAKRPVPTLGDLTISAVYLRSETWCQAWFSHWTWANGRTDQELLQSFQAYVMRIEELNWKSQREAGKDVLCLMGAEDRYRWRGREDSKAPCRCEHCEKLGIVRIDH